MVNGPCRSHLYSPALAPGIDSLVLSISMSMPMPITLELL
jgi:hypothetical protein